ncbi:MAG: hypothetical protein WCC00_06580 [Candidatus Aminicenantales bacterium]
MLERLISDRKVILRYLRAGLDIADYRIAKYAFRKYEHLKIPREQAFSKWEREYARRGYATLPIGLFENYHNRHLGLTHETEMIADADIKPFLVKRAPGQEPVYYADEDVYSEEEISKS